MPRSEATEFVVEVLEGPASGATIPLVGRELPFRAAAGGAVSYGRTQRTKLTWYQGNPEATQQVIGRTLAPTTINGIWSERYLGEDRPIDLVELFEELCDMGCQVRVSWQTIVRQGIVKQVTWKPGDPTGGLGDVSWEIVFEWRAAGIPPRRRAFEGLDSPSLRVGCSEAATDIGDLIQMIRDFVSSSDSLVGLSKIAFDPTKATLEDDADALDQHVSKIASAAVRIGDAGDASADLLEQASSAMGSAGLVSADAGSVFSGVFPAITQQSDSLSDVINELITRADVQDQVFKTLEKLFVERVRLESLLRPDRVVIITAIVGSDLRDVAVRYYGNADLWQRIAEANGIESSLIPDDMKEIVVPLSVGVALDRGAGA